MAETQPQLHPALLRLSAMISQNFNSAKFHRLFSAPRKDHRGVHLIADARPFGRAVVTPGGARSVMQSATRSITTAHKTLWFAFTMPLAMW